MAAGARSVQELVERQGHSFKAAVQAAVAEHHTGQQVHRPETHSKPDAPIQVVHTSTQKKITKGAPKFKPKAQSKAEPKVESKAEPLPTPQSTPQTLGPAASQPTGPALPLSTGPALPMPARPSLPLPARPALPSPAGPALPLSELTKRAAEPSQGVRRPPQPMPAKKRDPERAPEERRSAPPQRKAETRRAARDLLDMYYKKNSGGGGAQILLDSAKKSTEFILKTGHSKPIQRPQDVKRNYDEVLKQIEDFAKSRAGMSIADIGPIGGAGAQPIGAPRRRLVY